MLTVEGVSKSFGPVKALSRVSTEFNVGEIHAVLGENGAGKSTLVHVLSGFVRPESGSVRLDGAELLLGNPFECRRAGIAMIHQHFTLAPGFTVRENLLLARVERMGVRDDAELLAPAMELSQELGWSIDLDARTGALPVGAQQRIEILKSLSNESKVAIFDEPTAVLGPDEVEDLFIVLRRLRDSGKIVILIAHKLQEVLAVADRVTVLRRGNVVAQSAIDGVTARELAEWMVGELPPELSRVTHVTTRPGLQVRNLRSRGDRGEEAVSGIELSVGRGEIVGIGGVDGNGQVELAEALAGVRPSTGEMTWEGQSIDAKSPRIAYIPQDRQIDGLALRMSIEDNFLIEGSKRASLTRGPFMRRRPLRAWVETLIERFEIVAKDVDAPVSDLSGGNQQKVVVARALDETPDLLVAVNPTRGLDVKATQYVHQNILGARDDGAAVVLISTDLDELAALSSRTVFLTRGRIASGEGATALVGGES